MKTVSAAKISAQFNDYLKTSLDQPVLVTRNGKPVAVLLGVKNQAEADLLALDPEHSLRSIFQAADEQLRQGEGVPHAKFWSEVEKSRLGKREPKARAKKPKTSVEA